MISIFVMYSNDRQEQFKFMLKSLEAMPYFKECQKTLVVDGKLVNLATDWNVIQVPRITGFCWAEMWSAGVATAKYENIWYLDSDRLLPPYYLQLLKDNVKDNAFCFTSRHFQMLKQLPYETCRDFLNVSQKEKIHLIDSLKYEIRFKKVTHTPKKNVMSGNTAFTKSTYYKLGGVDKWYCGHGAFADNDFHATAEKAGCEFIDLEVPELHCPHTKLEGDKVLAARELNLLAVKNYKYYCKKWGLPDSYWMSLKV